MSDAARAQGCNISVWQWAALTTALLEAPGVLLHVCSVSVSTNVPEWRVVPRDMQHNGSECGGDVNSRMDCELSTVRVRVLKELP